MVVEEHGDLVAFLFVDQVFLGHDCKETNDGLQDRFTHRDRRLFLKIASWWNGDQIKKDWRTGQSFFGRNMGRLFYYELPELLDDVCDINQVLVCQNQVCLVVPDLLLNVQSTIAGLKSSELCCDGKHRFGLLSCAKHFEQL